MSLRRMVFSEFAGKGYFPDDEPDSEFIDTKAGPRYFKDGNQSGQNNAG